MHEKAIDAPKAQERDQGDYLRPHNVRPSDHPAPLLAQAASVAHIAGATEEAPTNPLVTPPEKSTAFQDRSEAHGRRRLSCAVISNFR